MGGINELLQTIASVMTYAQNIGQTMSMPDSDYPAVLKKIMAWVSDVMVKIAKFIPTIPAFDIRAQFVFMSLGLPFVVDLAFTWLVTPCVEVFFHLVDVAVLLVTAMIVAKSVAQDVWSSGNMLATALGCAYISMRFAVFVVRGLKRKKSEYNMYTLCQAICTHFISHKGTEYEIKVHIRELSKAIAIEVAPPGKCYMAAMIIIIILVTTTGVFTIGVIPFTSDLPTIANVAGYIALIVAGILFVMLMMRCGRRGRKMTEAVSAFGIRYGLRLLMFIFEILYIPILQYFVEICTPTEVSCEKGSYLFYDRVPSDRKSDIWFGYVNHTAECKACSLAMMVRHSECQAACSGAVEELRLKGAVNLLFVDDVVKLTGGAMICCLLLAIGIPSLWSYVVHTNRRVVLNTNVWGRTVHDKWIAIVHRMRTTGMYMFCDYKVNCCYWKVWIFMVKFLVMLTTTVAGRLYRKAMIALPVLYFVVVISYCWFRPFLYGPSNVLDIVLYSGNSVFAVIAVLADFGYSITSTLSLVVNACVILAPVISVIFILCCKHPVWQPDDATLSDRERNKQKNREVTKKRTKQGEMQEPLNKDNESLDETVADKKRRKKRQKRNRELESHLRKMARALDELTNLDEERKEDKLAGNPRKLRFVMRDNKAKTKEMKKLYDNEKKKLRDAIMETALSDDSVEDLDPPKPQNPEQMPDEIARNLLMDTRDEDCTRTLRNRRLERMYREAGLPSNNITIKAGQLDSIERLWQHRAGVRVQSEKRVEPNRQSLIMRVGKMYRWVDQVIDVHTIETVTTVLKWWILAGAVAFGWYIGGVRGTLVRREELLCL